MINKESLEREELLNLKAGSLLYVAYYSNSAKKYENIGLCSVIDVIKKGKSENEANLRGFDLYKDSSNKINVDISYPLVTARLTIPKSPRLEPGIVANFGCGPEPLRIKVTPYIDAFFKILEENNHITKDLHKQIGRAAEELTSERNLRRTAG